MPLDSDVTTKEKVLKCTGNGRLLLFFKQGERLKIPQHGRSNTSDL